MYIILIFKRCCLQVASCKKPHVHECGSIFCYYIYNYIYIMYVCIYKYFIFMYITCSCMHNTYHVPSKVPCCSSNLIILNLMYLPPVLRFKIDRVLQRKNRRRLSCHLSIRGCSNYDWLHLHHASCLSTTVILHIFSFRVQGTGGTRS